MEKILLHKIFTKIFVDENLPFLELRYSNNTKHYKEHIHETFSMGINIKGKSIYTNKNEKFEFEKDMIAIVNTNEIHSCNPINETPNLYYMLYLDENWCFKIQKSIDKNLKKFQPFPNAILYSKEVYETFKTLCEIIFSDISFEEKEEELINFFSNLFECYLEKSNQKIEDNSFEEITNFLKDNYTENISIEDLASKFNINRFYLIRVFKSKLNITPHAYFLNIKINRAKELLKMGNSITQTALECGFTDQSHFHRNFLKIVATTPKSYQDNFKINFVQD